MNDLNHVLLSGNLTSDPNLKMINEETSVCEFTIAVNRRYFDKKKEKWMSTASFIPVESWGNAAQACAQYLTKGRGIRVVGRLVHSSWKDASGNTHDKYYIVSQHIEFQPVKKPEEPDAIVSDSQEVTQEEEVQAVEVE